MEKYGSPRPDSAEGFIVDLKTQMSSYFDEQTIAKLDADTLEGVLNVIATDEMKDAHQVLQRIAAGEEVDANQLIAIMERGAAASLMLTSGDTLAGYEEIQAQVYATQAEQAWTAFGDIQQPA